MRLQHYLQIFTSIIKKKKRVTSVYMGVCCIHFLCIVKENNEVEVKFSYITENIFKGI